MKSLKVHTISLGCPKNRVDTEYLLGAIPGGVQAVDAPQEAEAVLINTCGFIAPAVEESVAAILEAAGALEEIAAEERPLLVVAGCLVARYGEELAKEMPEVGLWLRPGEIAPWRTLLEKRFFRNDKEEGAMRLLSTPPGYAYLKIGEGCDHACRYCTIPKLRGRLCSGDDAQLESEARSLLARGVKELILVAQDLTAHGLDRGDPNGLMKLLERLLPLDGLDWLRLMYMYPAGLTDTLLQFLKQAGPPFVPYFDIPFQHAHPAVLERMGRPGQGARSGKGPMVPPESVVERVRGVFPDAVLRTSLIVGYPGETEEEFATLLRFVEKQRLQHVGVFAFHAEEGTVAAKLPEQLPESVKEERRYTLMELQREISAELLEDNVGERMQVLVDAPHDEWPGLHMGRVWSQAPEADGVTWVSGEGVTPGAMVQAEIVEAQEYDLVALA